MNPNNNSQPKKEAARKLTEKEVAELEQFCKTYSDWLLRTFRDLNADDEKWAEFSALTEFPDRPTLKKAPFHQRSKSRRTHDV